MHRPRRLQGDEFVILCEHTTRLDAEALAQRIASALAQPVGERKHVVTSSIGIVSSRAGSAPLSLIEQADAPMYRAKMSGKNAVSF